VRYVEEQAADRCRIDEVGRDAVQAHWPKPGLGGAAIFGIVVVVAAVVSINLKKSDMS
jgi:hypothetical protein